jgi:hypothetical protein
MSGIASEGALKRDYPRENLEGIDIFVAKATILSRD